MSTLKNLVSCILILGCIEVSAQTNCPTWEWASPVPINIGSEIITSKSDASGNMYVLGSFLATQVFGPDTLTTNGRAFFVAKYDTARAWQWGVKFSAEPDTNNRSFGAIDLYYSPSGLISVVGNFGQTASFGNINLTASDSAYRNLFVAMLDANTRQWLWANYAECESDLRATSVVHDATGNTYVSGVANSIFIAPTKDTLHFGNINLIVDSAYSFISNISNNGVWQWAKTAASKSKTPHLALSASGDIALAGTFSGNLIFNGQTISNPYNNYRICVLGYSSSGAELWALTSISTSTFSQTIQDLLSDNYNNFYLTASSQNTETFGSITISPSGIFGSQILAKIESNRQWRFAQKLIESPSFTGSAGHQMTISTQGDLYSFNKLSYELYVGQDTLTPYGLNSIYVSKMDSNGVYQWAGGAYPAVPTNSSAARFHGIGVTNAGNVFIMGAQTTTMRYGFHTIANYERFTAKIIPNGSVSIYAGPDTLLYCSEEITLNPYFSSVANLSFQWTPAAGLDDPTLRTPKASPDSTTTYTVIASTKQGCFASDKITIFRDSTLRQGGGINFTTSTGGFTYCNGNSLTISATPGYDKYLWSNGDTTNTTTPTGPGFYVLLAKEPTGCYRKDSIEILHLATISSPNTLLCKNDSVELNLNLIGVDSLYWSTGSNSSKIYVSQPGKYWVYIKKNNCTYVDTIDVIAFSDTANAHFNHQGAGLTVNFSPVSIGISKGVWDFGDGNAANSISASHTYAAYGTYYVCYDATDVCGYTAQVCDSVVVQKIGLSEIPKPTQISLYPNPTSGILTIKSEIQQRPKLLITDLSGRIIIQKELTADKSWQVDLSHLAPGYYILHLDEFSTKIVKL